MRIRKILSNHYHNKIFKTKSLNSKKKNLILNGLFNTSGYYMKMKKCIAKYVKIIKISTKMITLLIKKIKMKIALLEVLITFKNPISMII